jgi:hypothetical protein
MVHSIYDVLWWYYPKKEILRRKISGDIHRIWEFCQEILYGKIDDVSKAPDPLLLRTYVNPSWERYSSNLFMAVSLFAALSMVILLTLSKISSSRGMSTKHLAIFSPEWLSLTQPNPASAAFSSISPPDVHIIQCAVITMNEAMLLSLHGSDDREMRLRGSCLDTSITDMFEKKLLTCRSSFRPFFSWQRLRMWS